MLSVRNLSSGYGQLRAVSGVELDVRAGEILAVLGRNGAGKTTLVHTIAGLLPHWTGKTTLDDRDLTKLPAHRRCHLGLATVLDGKRVFHGQTVERNLLVPRLPRSARSRPSYDDVAREMFPILREFAHRRAGSLSGGQQQMLLLAQALSLRPSVLILDEPSAGLAPAIVDEVFAALRRLADLGLGVLLVEQLLDKSVAIADRAQVLELGSMVGAWQAPAGAVSEIRESLRLTHA